ncbi:hypothetical protein ACFQU2_24040 [Siccirubricoccus deserti]
MPDTTVGDWRSPLGTLSTGGTITLNRDAAAPVTRAVAAAAFITGRRNTRRTPASRLARSLHCLP